MRFGEKRFLPYKMYVLCNILLVIVPIVTLVLLFFQSMRAQMLNEVLEMRASAQDRVAGGIEEMLGNFGSMVLYAAMDPDLTPYQLKQNNYGTVTALRHLKLHASSLSDMKIYFYIHGDDRFYSSAGGLSFSTFERVYRFEGGWTGEDFFGLINGAWPYAASPSGCSLVTDDARGERYMAIVYPWTNAGSAYGTAVALLRMSWFEERMRAQSDGPAYILDAEGNILFGGETQADQALVRAALASRPEGKARVDGQINHWVWRESALNGWQYLTVVPAAHIDGLLMGEHMVLFLLALVLALGLAVVGVLLAMRYYLPIDSLSRMLGADKASDARQIHDRVSRILRINQDMRSELDETRDHMRQDFYAKLLTGGLSEEECRDRLERSVADMSGPLYAVLVVDLGSGVPVRERNAAFAVLQGAGLRVAEALYRDYLAILYSGAGEARFADDLAERVGCLLADVPGLHPRVGAGQPCGALSEMNRSFVEAVAAVENGSEEMGYFSDLTQSQLSGLDRPLYQERMRLAETIRQGGALAVERIFGELSGLLEALAASADQAALQFSLNGILYELLPTLEEAGLAGIGWALNLAVHASRPEEFIAHLRPLCVRAAEAFAWKRGAWMNEKIADVLSYIDLHYCEQELSLGGIAERFDMTNTSLSRLFSEYTGTHFIDYVSKKRMERAAELLRSTDLGVREVVTMVGYIDVSSFTRKFTKAYGVNPSAYRKRNVSGES